MEKNATWADAHKGIQAHLESCLQDHLTTKAAELTTEQGTHQSKGIAKPSSDSEVKAFLPNGGNAGETHTDLATERGKEVGEEVPGQPNPTSTKELERKEVAPSTKLAGDARKLAERLVGNLRDVALVINKSANSPVPAEPDAQAALAAVGAGTTKNKIDTSDAVPKTESTEKVTQTEIHSGTPGKPEQGTDEKEPGSKVALDVNSLAYKVARFVHAFGYGHDKVAQVIDIFNGQAAAPVSPELQQLDQIITAKTAEWKAAGLTDQQIAQKIAEAAAIDANNMKLAELQQEAILGGAHSLAALGLQSGIITQKQANDLLASAGIPQPELPGRDIRQKVASCREIGMKDEQILAYIQKCAMHDPSAEAAQPSGAPDPQQIQQALAQAIQELFQAVQSGQITEEQALDLLRQEGLPVDQMLAQGGAGGDPGAAGGAPGGDPAAGGGAPGLPPGGLPPGGPAPGGAAGGAPGGAPGGSPVPPDGGGAPDTGGEKPEAKKEEKSDDKKEKSKDKEPDGDEGSEGGEKEASKKKGEVHLSDPAVGGAAGFLGGPLGGAIHGAVIGGPGQAVREGGRSLLEGTAGTALGGAAGAGIGALIEKLVPGSGGQDDHMIMIPSAVLGALLGHAVGSTHGAYASTENFHKNHPEPGKVAEGLPAEGAVAGDSVGESPEQGGDPAGGAPGGDPGGAPGGELQAIMSDLQAAVASGQLSPEQASSIAGILQGGAGGASPSPADPGSSAAPAPPPGGAIGAQQP